MAMAEMKTKDAVDLIGKLLTDIMPHTGAPLPYVLTGAAGGGVSERAAHRNKGRASVLALTLCNPVALAMGQRIEEGMKR